MEIKSKTFTGGYRFRNFVGKPQKKVIQFQVPPTVTIPLKQGFGDEVAPVVEAGEYVKAGQIIGISDDSMSSPVHSSVSGIVEGIIKISCFKEDIHAVVIKSDGTADWQPLQQHTSNWTSLTVEQIEKLLYLSGVTSLNRIGIPTRYKSSIILTEDVKNLIIHGVNSEPYNLSPSVLLQDNRIFHFVEGIKILKAVMPKAHIHIALGSDEEDLLKKLSSLSGDCEWLDFYSLIPKYPQGHDEILISTILGKRYLYGYSTANTGVVVLDIQTVLQAYDAVAGGKPLIERIIAISGPGWKENIHLKVRIGTPLQYILVDHLQEEGRYRLIFDSLLTNDAVIDFSLPVNRTLSQLIAVPENTNREKLSFLRAGLRRYSYSKTFLSALAPKVDKACDTNIHGEERPCIFCGYCEEVCPAGIIPHLLEKYVTNNIIDEKLVNYGIFNCIKCNVCSFVCPSKIPIAERIMEGREKLIGNNYGCPHCNLPDLESKKLADKVV